MAAPPRVLAAALCAWLAGAFAAPLALAMPQTIVRHVSASGAVRREALPAGTGLVQLTAGDRVLRAQAIDPTAPLRVLVEFDTPPGIVARASGVRAARPEIRLEQLRADLGALSAAMAKPGRSSAAAVITNSYSEVFSGAAVTLAPELLAGVRKLAYVRRVVMDDSVHVNLEQSVPLIRADSLRNTTGATGAGIRVGIVDTGLDYTHPALGGGFGPGHRVAGGYDFVNNDADPRDDHGHGTHVAGIVAGNGGGVTGVAPGATLYAFKVLAAAGYGYNSWILAALDRVLDPDQNAATDDAMDVINLSLGAPGGDPDDPLSLALDHLMDAGVVCCVAAGNDGMYRTIGSPGTSRRAITVGATDLLDSLAWFTSKGPVPRTYDMKPEVMAPGVGIVSSQMGGGTVAMSGTSMATPHMAGCAALLLQLHPAWTTDQVKSALTTTAHAIGSTPLERGSGRVDVLDAASAEIAFAPSHVAFGRVLASAPSWSRTDTLRLRNLTDHARTVVLPGTVTLAPGAVVHVSPGSVVLPPGGTAIVLATLAVDNALLADPAQEPYGYSGELHATCNGRSYAIPVTLHQHSSIAFVSETGVAHMLIVEDHATRALVYADMQPSTDIPVPPGAYDVTVSFFPYYTFVAHTNVAVNDTATVVIEPDEATVEQTFAYTDNEGNPLVQNSGSLRIRRPGSNWELSWIGFPVEQVLSSSTLTDYDLEWTCADTDYRSHWKAFSGAMHGITTSQLHDNPPNALHHFRMTVPQVSTDPVGELFYDFHPNPPSWGGYFGIGFYDGVPRTGPFTVDFDIMPMDQDHFQMGNSIEMYSLDVTNHIDWNAGPLMFTPQLRTNHGWPIETHEAAMLFEPASWFGGDDMQLFGGLPVWRGMFHNYDTGLSLDEGGLFYAPHFVADSYGSVMLEPDPEYTLLQGGAPIDSGVLAGAGTFMTFGAAGVSLPEPGAFELRTHRDYVRNGLPSRLDVSALVNTTLADPDPPSLRAFQVHAQGEEADSIDFAEATDAAVHFQMSDAGEFIPELQVREAGAGAWIPVAVALQGAEFAGALPVTLSGDIALRLKGTDASGNAITFTWDHAFWASPGHPAGVAPGPGAAAVFALDGARPNPARAGRLDISFALPVASSAELELLDVAGRRLARRDVGVLGAGRHVVRMEPATPLRPGIYFARLTQQGRTISARLCVMP